MLTFAAPCRLHLFAGPSLDADTTGHILSDTPCTWTLAGPVQQGDILRLVDDPPQVIAILDGYFHQVPAVLHKEILLALEMGIRVLGAASMGALRAAELQPYGMEGVGQIFRWYREGIIDGDDEVALLHAPAELGYRGLTQPLVNVRYNLRRARERQIVTEATEARLLAVARRIHYTQRDQDQILQQARRAGVPESELDAWGDYVRREAVDLKRQDALELVHQLAARLRGQSPWPDVVRPQVARSRSLHLFQRDYGQCSLNGCPPIENSLVVDLERIAAPRFDRYLARIARRCLLLEEARHRGLQAAEEPHLLESFLRVRGLEQAALDNWLRRQGLTRQELVRHLQDLDLLHRLLFPRQPQLADGRLLADGQLPGDGALADGTALADRALVEGTALADGCQWGVGHGRRAVQRFLQDLSDRRGIPVPDLTRPLCMRPAIPWEGPLLRTMKVQGRFRRAWLRAERIRAYERARWQGRDDAARLYEALFDYARPALERWLADRWGVPLSQLHAAAQARGFATQADFLQAARRVYDYQTAAAQQASGGMRRGMRGGRG